MNEPMNDMDERIRAALHAAVDDLHEGDLRPALPPQTVPDRHRTIRWAAPLLAAAAVVAVVVTSVAVSSGSQAAKHTVPPAGTLLPTPTPKQTPTLSPSTATVPAKTPEPTVTEEPTQSTKTPPPDSTLLGYEPLWPFANIGQVRAWQAQTGSQPWHLDAGVTALFFAQNYLKFSDITDVTSKQITAKDAHIGVGYRSPGGQLHTAAVLHLLRFADDATDTSAPWEVVGATSIDFTMDPPTLADAIVELVTARGRITGVDENITVAVRTLSGSVAQSRPAPAGGENARWANGVRTDERGVLTVVASTGGHVTAHERFVVTGISVR
jgi:hypothetical protein